MVSLFVGIALALTATAGPADAAAARDDTVRESLARGGYPWYDSRTDSLIAIRTPASRERDQSRIPDVRVSNPGRYVSIGLAILGIALFIALLVELWRRYEPAAGQLPSSPSSSPIGRITGLPAGLNPELGDPWAEALRCRERGDYSRAIVCVFAHQLIALERLRVLRLAPGRTGRQLVRAIDDPRLRGPVEQTLRLFETVYYGQVTPSAAVFESVWSHAQEFERLITEGARR